MPFAQDKATTTRVYPPVSLPGIAEGDWLELRNVSTAEIRQRCVAAATKVHYTAKKGEEATAKTDVDAMAYHQALMEEVIVAWSDPAPITEDALATLHPDVQDWIAEEFERLTDRTPEAKNASGSNSTDISASDEEPSLPSLVTSQR